MRTIKKHEYGFTLVELSIVIVIIGLIVAGVTAGQSLVKQAKLSKIITDFNSYQVAYTSFKLQYDYLPGDILNASSYWPSCDATPSNCNGNGNKRIEYTGTDSKRETMRVWQHLALAGLIPGTYTGTGDRCQLPNTSCPKGPIPDSVFVDRGDDGLVFWTWENKPAFIFGKIVSSTILGVINVAEAKSIDTKMDDGVANKGKMHGISGYGQGGCSEGPGYAPGADYILSSTTNTCYLTLSYR